MDAQYDYGCAFCMSTSEDRHARMLEKAAAGLEAIVPRKLRMRRAGGESTEESVVLFPGYIFFRATADALLTGTAFELSGVHILRDSEGLWKLRGADRLFAEEFFRIGGTIGFSKVTFDDNQRIRIISGIFKGCEGEVRRVNRRARTMEIGVKLQDKLFTAWLGYEEVEEIKEEK